MSKALSSAGHSLVAVQDNLIDAIWEDRPARPSTKLITLALKFTGQHISLDDLQQCFSKSGSGPASISYLKSTNYIAYFDKCMLILYIICYFIFFMYFGDGPK